MAKVTRVITLKVYIEVDLEDMSDETTPELDILNDVLSVGSIKDYVVNDVWDLDEDVEDFSEEF